MKVKIKKNYLDSKIPVMGNPYAMCFDCYAYDIKINKITEKVTIDLGISVELPEDYGMRIIPRSNIGKHFYMLGNSIGIVDPDYRGPLVLNFNAIPVKVNDSCEAPQFKIDEFPYKAGDRVCQIEIYKKEKFTFEIVDELSSTERGDKGFGSTGLA